MAQLSTSRYALIAYFNVARLVVVRDVVVTMSMPFPLRRSADEDGGSVSRTCSIASVCMSGRVRRVSRLSGAAPDRCDLHVCALEKYLELLLSLCMAAGY